MHKPSFRQEWISTLKFALYIPAMILYCMVGIIYRPLKWVVTKTANF